MENSPSGVLPFGGVQYVSGCQGRRVPSLLRRLNWLDPSTVASRSFRHSALGQAAPRLRQWTILWPLCAQAGGPLLQKLPPYENVMLSPFFNVSRRRQTQTSQSVLGLSMIRCTVRVARVVHDMHAAQLRLSCVLWGTIDGRFALVMFSKINIVFGGSMLRRDKGPRVVADSGIRMDLPLLSTPIHISSAQLLRIVKRRSTRQVTRRARLSCPSHATRRS